MFETVLVAARGVTALRVLRTCERLGVLAVAVHADDDARAAHVRAADEAVPLGGQASAQTYGDTRKLLEAALRSGAQAVHPGDGPVARDPGFARAVLDAGLAWLGPPPAPAPPATTRAGGRIVTVTLLDRGAGVVECLGRREHLGRLLDEEPAGLTSAQAREVTEAAAGLMSAADVRGVCAVEVAIDGEGVSATGLQPVSSAGSTATAAVAGLDLEVLQLHLVAGEAAPDPAERAGNALALHLRVPEGFAGRLRRFRLPTGPGVRSDAGVREGDQISRGSDRLLAVVTVTGADRAEVLARARASLDGVEVAGVPTTLPMLRAVLADPSFAAGAPDRLLLERISRS